MSTERKMIGLLVTLGLLSSLMPWSAWSAAPTQGTLLNTQEIPEPLPRDCDDVTPPGEDPPDCCIYGYIYHQGEPVTGASVHLESPSSALELITTAGGASTEPYYSVDLVAAPLLVSPGDVLTITAEYGDMVSMRSWTVQSDGQHVDLGLVPGYQATEPLSYLLTYPAPLTARQTPERPATEVGGPITEDTIWTQADSPYIATSSVQITEAVTLTIEPGVEIRFDGNHALQVDGQLIAQGTPTHAITFTHHVTPGWSYITFSDSSVDAVYDVSGNYVSGSILEYAVVEYAGYASVSHNAAVRMNNAHPLISNCIIRDSQAAGVSAWDLSERLRITDSTIEDNGAAGVEAWLLPGTLEVLDSTISNNGASGIYARAESNWGGDPGAVNILNNIITGNSGHGVYFGVDYYNGARVVISGNTIGNNSSDKGGGIHVYYYEYKTGWFKKIEISRNILYDNSASEEGGAIWFSYGCAECGIPGTTITVTHNVIGSNTATVNGGGIWAGHGIATIANNSIVDNTSWNTPAVCFCESGIPQGAWEFSDNTIKNNQATDPDPTCTVYVRRHPSINQNNIFTNTATYTLWNGNAESSANVDAENDWWGTTNSGEIAAAIYDWFDNSDLGIVDYDPYLASPNLSAPISPPSGLIAEPSGMAISLNWSSNLEGDLVGYKVYYDTDSPGFPYEGSDADEGASPIDVGNTTSFTLTALTPGTYHVSVTAYDTAADGENDWTDGNESWFAPNQEILIAEAPQADFGATPLSGTIPLTVTFTDQSIGSITNWDWDFGDEGGSTEQNPAHVYTRTGTYTVSLTVDGPGGSDTETKANYISLDYPIPSAEFSGTPLTGTVPLTVFFNDESTGPIIAWDWVFGEAGTSGARHPRYEFTSPGTYSISLTVSGPGGSDTETRADYVTPVATVYLPIVMRSH